MRIPVQTSITLLLASVIPGGADVLPKPGASVCRVDWEVVGETPATCLADFFGRFVHLTWVGEGRDAEAMAHLRARADEAAALGAVVVQVSDGEPEQARALAASLGWEGPLFVAEERKELVKTFGEGPMGPAGQGLLIDPFGRVIEWDHHRILRLLGASRKVVRQETPLWDWSPKCADLVSDIRAGDFSEIWHTYRRLSTQGDGGEPARRVLDREDALMLRWLEADPYAARRRASWFRKEFARDYCCDGADELLRKLKTDRGLRAVLADQEDLRDFEELGFPAGIDGGPHSCPGESKCSKVAGRLEELLAESAHPAVRGDAERLLGALRAAHPERDE